MKSQYFSVFAIRAFIRLGDIVIPRNGEFPSFSEYGGFEHLDKAAAYAPRDDIRLMNLLMSVLAVAPTFVLRWLVMRASTSHRSNSVLAPIFRKLYFGWWGLLFGCYYSNRPGADYHGKDPVEFIQYELNRVEDQS